MSSPVFRRGVPGLVVNREFYTRDVEYAGFSGDPDLGSYTQGKAPTVTDPRVTFVQGKYTSDPANDPSFDSDNQVACGPGTSYPLQVTVAQLYKLMYRVKDLKNTGGTLETKFTSVTEGENPSTYIVTATTQFRSGDEEPGVDTQLAKVVTGNDRGTSIRGYVTAKKSTDGDPMDPSPSGWFGTSYQLTQGSSTINFRDAADVFALWASKKDDTTGAPSNELVGNYDMDLGYGMFNFISIATNGPSSFRTGFSVSARSSLDTDSTAAGLFAPSTRILEETTDAEDYTYGEGAGISMEFTGRVAWVNDTGSGNPFDPGNRLFVEMLAHIEGGTGIDFLNEYRISTSWKDIRTSFGITDDGANIDSQYNLKLNLDKDGSDIVSCKLYYDTRNGAEGPKGPSDEDFVLTITDWEFQATANWDYTA